MDGYLIVTKITIKETKVEVLRKPLWHLDDRQRDMILLRDLVEFSVIDTHPSSYDGSLWN